MGGEAGSEPDARSAGDAHFAQGGLARAAGVGMRSGEEELAARGASYFQGAAGQGFLATDQHGFRNGCEATAGLSNTDGNSEGHLIRGADGCA